MRGREGVGLQLNLLKARPLFSSTGKTSREEDLGEKKWRISKNFNIRSLLSTSPLTYRTPRPFVGPPFLPSSLPFAFEPFVLSSQA